MSRERDHRRAERKPCEYCGLPIRGSTSIEARFCCLGCRVAQDVLRGDGDSGIGKTALQLGLAVFFSMNVMVFTMVLWSWDAYTIAASENADTFKELMRISCLLFATPVVLILGRPLVDSVVSQFRTRIITADSLLLLAF